ncbi:MAG: segregation/condensation protein A [Cellvibrionales bacterium]|nr:MAG: segregation/condensation protein A [Cellvibrionales bacterium]
MVNPEPSLENAAEPLENAAEPLDQADVDPGNSSEQGHPEQDEMSFAIVKGQQLTELPKDLYIPPEALEVILEAFEGPLDLLLYLIKRQNLDILEINVAEITHQYMAYIEMMQAMRWDLAAEYLLMAAMLAEIKSRMLLPRQDEHEEDEGDPRANLIRRLQEYERFKSAAEDIDKLPRTGRDTFVAEIRAPERGQQRPEPSVSIQELLVALAATLQRAELLESHHISFEVLSTRERMSQVLTQLRGRRFVPFQELFSITEGRNGVVVTFLALLELMKEALVEIVQGEPLGPIHVKARTN